MIHLRRSGWLVACLALVAGGAFGQTFYGSLVGSVQDSTGAVIPGASVTVTSLATGEQRAQETEGGRPVSLRELGSGPVPPRSAL